mgnify:CR=1 FL=1
MVVVKKCSCIARTTTLKVNGVRGYIHVADLADARRAGYLSKLIARAGNIREVLGWTPKEKDLHTIVKTSIDWKKKLAGPRMCATQPIVFNLQC